MYCAAVYVRLSKEDGDKGESDSIVNQKDFIYHFLEGQSDITVFGEYVDDGYSGVNFERPGFKRMMQEVAVGQIDCVVVKDLSRFGRNFVETGRYLERVFPALGVRFIAINDGVDSAKGQTSSDRILIPFKNLMNDAYCRDISVKIRSQLEVKRKNGEFIGSFAVYGYRKSPEDRHRLIVDRYAADVVQEIFKWKLEGASQQKIADWLNERGELSPLEYKRFCGLPYQSGFQVNLQTKWSAVAVGRILCNEYYIGTLVQGKRTTPNHKVKKIIQKPEEEWIRIENHHPPIIKKEDFFAVKRLLLQDTRVAPKEEMVYLFSGLVFCGDCGQNLVRNSVRRNGKNYCYYMCGNNRTNRVCSSHRIRDSLLESAVFFSVRQQMGMADFERVSSFFDWQEGRERREEKKREREFLKQKKREQYCCFRMALERAKTEGLIDQAEYLERKKIYDKRLQSVWESEGKEKWEGVERRGEDEQRKGMICLLMGDIGNRIERDERELESFWNSLDRTGQSRYLIVNLIERIVVYEDCRIEIQFRYRDQGKGFM